MCNGFELAFRDDCFESAIQSQARSYPLTDAIDRWSARRLPVRSTVQVGLSKGVPAVFKSWKGMTPLISSKPVASGDTGASKKCR